MSVKIKEEGGGMLNHAMQSRWNGERGEGQKDRFGGFLWYKYSAPACPGGQVNYCSFPVRLLPLLFFLPLMRLNSNIGLEDCRKIGVTIRRNSPKLSSYHFTVSVCLC
jgi:hypothetical protein